MRKTKDILVNIALFAFVFLFCLVMLEIIIRIGIHFYEAGYPYPENLFIADDEMGYRLNDTGFVGIMKGRKPYEFSNLIHIRDGWRDNLKDNIDILILGDSFTFGFGVEEEERYSNFLRNYYPNKTIFNAAISGHGTYEYNIVLERLFDRLSDSPSIIIVGVVLGNDILDNSKHGMHRTVYNGKLHYVPYNIFRLPKQHHIFIARYIKLYGFINNRIYNIVSSEEGIWRDNEKSLNNMLSKVKKKNGTLYLLFIYSKSDIINGTIENYKNSLLYSDYCSKHEKVICIDTLPEFRSFKNREELYYPYDGHWTREGHKNAARLIYNQLEADKNGKE